MEDSGIKQQLLQFIEHGDQRLLHILYAVASEYNNVQDEDADEIAELERRQALRLSGQSKVYDWEEAKRMITSKKSA